MGAMGKEFIRYVSFSILGMLGSAGTILADTMFVSNKLGTEGLAALNIAISVFGLVNGVGMLFGVGGATRYAVLKAQQRSMPIKRLCRRCGRSWRSGSFCSDGTLGSHLFGAGAGCRAGAPWPVRRLPENHPVLCSVFPAESSVDGVPAQRRQAKAKHAHDALRQRGQRGPGLFVYLPME